MIIKSWQSFSTKSPAGRRMKNFESSWYHSVAAAFVFVSVMSSMPFPMMMTSTEIMAPSLAIKVPATPPGDSLACGGLRAAPSVVNTAKPIVPCK